MNFFVLLVLLLTSVGYVSPLASLHQFVTNPTLEEQNGTQKVRKQLVPHGQTSAFVHATVMT